MKSKILLFLAIVVFSCKQTEKTEQKENGEITKNLYSENKNIGKINIVGTFHFGNTTDYSAIVIEDLSSEKRQKELENLVENLAEFRPTKILVEREPSFTDTLTQRLAEYKKGNYELPENEVYQLGFRLAKMLELDTIYGIDYQMGLGDEELVGYLNKNGLMDKFAETLESAKVWAEKQTEFLKNKTIGESLANLNNEETDNFNRNLYVDGILNIAENGNSPASEYVANWYKRNIFIKKNIDDLINKNDRVLVIIGAGHSAILKDFYRSSEKVEYVELKNIAGNN